MKNRNQRPGPDEIDRISGPLPSAVILESWQHISPVLRGSRVTLREVRAADAIALLSAISATEVTRFISPPPDSVEGFEQFIALARRRRSTGEAVCFGVLPAGYDTPVGLFQVRRIEPQFRVAEWGFAVAREFWGEGLFSAAAPLVIDWVFETLGALRLEARSAITNGRGNGALRKVGAVQEAVLRKSLLREGEYVDQVLWTLTIEQWQRLRSTHRANVH